MNETETERTVAEAQRGAEKAAKRVVARGVALLDERIPGWADRISIIDLDLGSTEYCVLGQVYGDEAVATTDDLSTAWGIGMRALFGTTTGASAYGFDRAGLVNYEDLREAWVPEIEARQTHPDQQH